MWELDQSLQYYQIWTSVWILILKEYQARKTYGYISKFQQRKTMIIKDEKMLNIWLIDLKTFKALSIYEWGIRSMLFIHWSFAWRRHGVVTDILTAQEKRDQAFVDFLTKRLSGDRTMKFFDTLTKIKL